MIESLVYMLLAIGNSFFDAFVFMFCIVYCRIRHGFPGRWGEYVHLAC